MKRTNTKAALRLKYVGKIQESEFRSVQRMRLEVITDFIYESIAYELGEIIAMPVY